MKMFKCYICSDATSCNVNELEAHISSIHFDCTPYECDHCKYSKFPTEYAIRRHFEVDHGLFVYYVKFQVTPALEEKKNKIQECLNYCLQPSESKRKLFEEAISKILNPKKKVEIHDLESTSDIDCQEMRERDKKHVIELSDDEDDLEVIAEVHHLANSSKINLDLLNSCSSNSFSALENTVDFRNTPLSSRVKEVVKFTLSTLAIDTQNSPETQENRMDEDNEEEQREEAPTLVNEEFASYEPASNSSMKTSAMNISLETLADTPELLTERCSTAQPVRIKCLRNSERTVTSCEMQENLEEPKLLKFSSERENHLKELQSSEKMIKIGKSSEPAAFDQDSNSKIFNDDDVDQPASDLIECKMCKEQVNNNLLSLNKHVNTKHTKYPFYKCKKCGEEFYWSEQEATSHVQQKHAGKEGCIINNWDKYYSRLNLRQARFFHKSQENMMECDLANGTGLVSERAYEHPRTDNYAQPEPLSIIDQRHMTISDFNQLLRVASVQELPSTPVQPLPEQAQSSRPVKKASKSKKCEGEKDKRRSVSSKSKKHVCNKCNDSITALDWTLLNHVNSVHMHLPLFECTGCSKTFEPYLRSYMIRHVKRYHNGDSTLIVDNREQYKKQLEQGSLHCFPKI